MVLLVIDRLFQGALFFPDIFSRIIPTRIGMFDLAPFILMLAVIFAQKFIVRTLFDMGMTMR